MPHLLITDDESATRELIAEVAADVGYTVAQAGDVRQARIQIERQKPDFMLLDMQLPDGDGIELWKRLELTGCHVVFMTGHSSVESAIEALRCGAVDYLLKPVPLRRLRGILAELMNAAPGGADEPAAQDAFSRIVGKSPAIQLLCAHIEKVAPTQATVLLVGESGTGKELAAEAIHLASRRRDKPFMAVNCGAISPNLIESELFGHEKGSFTGADRQHKGFFERAHGGTLFLDEITEMPAELQVKLLRVLETGTFTRVGTTQPISSDVRLIAATNRNPEQAVAEGKLRQDLYHRLNVFPIAMPPLRDRGTDIELLAQHFLAALNKQEGAAKAFAPTAIAALYAHSWPGNVRELRNYVQRAFILADELIDADLAPTAVTAPESAPLLTVRVGTTLDEVGRRLIEATLAECGSKRKAADM